MNTEKTLLDEVALSVMTAILSNEARFREVTRNLGLGESFYSCVAKRSYIAAKSFLEEKQRIEQNNKGN